MAFTPSGSSFSRGRSLRNKFQKKEAHRINELIKCPQVRLVDENGQQAGVVSTRDALKRAQNVGLDLMEVAPNENPPVCKICDYGKFKYEKKKKDNVAKKKQTVIKVKEVQFRPNTETHDLDYKFKNVRNFLEGGDKAKVSVLFRGRQITHKEQGFKIVEDLIEKMKDVGSPESSPKMEGRRLIVILAPVSSTKRTAATKEAKPAKPKKESKPESK